MAANVENYPVSAGPDQYGNQLYQSVVSALNDEFNSVGTLLNDVVRSPAAKTAMLHDVDTTIAQIANILEILGWNNARDAVSQQRAQLARLGVVGDPLRRGKLAEDILVELLAVASLIENSAVGPNDPHDESTNMIKDPLRCTVFAELAVELNCVEALLSESLVRFRPGFLERTIIGLRNIAGSLYFLDMHRAVAVITACGASLMAMNDAPDHEWRLRMVSGVLTAIEQYLYVFPHDPDAAEVLLTGAEDYLASAKALMKTGLSGHGYRQRVADIEGVDYGADMAPDRRDNVLQNAAGLMTQWRISPDDTSPAKKLSRELHRLSVVAAEDGENEISHLSRDIGMAIDAAINSSLPVTRNVFEAIAYSLSGLTRKLEASAAPA